MAAYYNEHDPQPAAWLRELIKQGHIAPGEVDERSIEDIRPNDLAGFTQCHFFAGIGVWSYALRRAGWPDDRPVWTGSCPCQPFSAAGKGDGFIDERHLWPAWYHLITQCRPPVIFGEQVASKPGLAWLDLVSTDLEGAGYANGAIDLCAASVGAPHIRQRLYFVGERLADAESVNSGTGSRNLESRRIGRDQHSDSREFGGVAHAVDRGRDETRQCESSPGCGGPAGDNGAPASQPTTSPTNGFWRDADWLFCRDGKWRPVRPGSLPLVNGASARVGRLRGYGNAINAEVATEFVKAYLGVPQ